MGDTKSIIQDRRTEESKMNRKMGSLELEMLRGFTLKPESTFHPGAPSAYSPNSTVKNILTSK
jgi:hypothetical protein